MADINTIDHIKNMLIEQNPVGLFYLNNDVIQFANDAFATILAIPLENILANHFMNLLLKNRLNC